MNKWNVDTITYAGWEWTAADSVDFVMELVHEIERLQTALGESEELARELAGIIGCYKYE